MIERRASADLSLIDVDRKLAKELMAAPKVEGWSMLVRLT
jgi:hypothetical protein